MRLIILAILISGPAFAQDVADDLEASGSACLRHSHYDLKASATIFDSGWESCNTVIPKWTEQNRQRLIADRKNLATKPAGPPIDDETTRQKMLGVSSQLNQQPSGSK